MTNAYFAGIRGWWADRLQPRERVLLGVLGGLLLALLLLYGLVLPLRGWAAEAQLRHAQAAQEQVLFSSQVAALGMARAAMAQRSDEPLAAIAMRTAGSAGVPLSATTPLADGGLALTFETARAPAVLDWIARLEQDEAIRISSLTLQRSTVGLVTGQVMLAP